MGNQISEAADVQGEARSLPGPGKQSANAMDLSPTPKNPSVDRAAKIKTGPVGRSLENGTDGFDGKPAQNTFVEDLKKQQMNQPRIAKHEIAFENRVEELVAFKNQFGHCSVPWSDTGRAGLRNWIVSLRYRRKRGQIPADRIARLDEMGFEWKPVSLWWEKKWEKLKAFKNQFGHCHVPLHTPRLGHWVGVQRSERRKGRLSADRVNRLDELGFVWKPERLPDDGAERRWNERYGRLKVFQKRHGHCRVPLTDQAFCKWVSRQRQHRRIGKLSADQIARLDCLGFDWNPDWRMRERKTWSERFEELKRYRETYGAGWLRCLNREKSGLTAWLNNQRYRRKQNQLSGDQIAMLDQFEGIWGRMMLIGER